MLEEFCDRWSVPAGNRTRDHRRVLEDSRVDSVSVAVDHAQHARLAIEALQAGKHVIVEKPLALTVADGRRVLDAAAEAARVVSVVSQHRYDPLAVEIERWTRSGLLGRPLYCAVTLECGRDASYYADSYWRGTWSGEGGSLASNQAYHCIDVVNWLVGPLTVLGARAATLVLGDVIETEDTIAALLEAADGAFATLAVSAGGRVFWRTTIQLVASDGTVVFDLDHPDTLHFAAGSPALEEAARAATVSRPEPPPELGHYGVSHRPQLAAFFTAVARGEIASCDAVAALDTLRVLEELYRAAGAPR
jgi:predicted dehydrogenase